MNTGRFKKIVTSDGMHGRAGFGMPLNDRQLARRLGVWPGNENGGRKNGKIDTCSRRLGVPTADGVVQPESCGLPSNGSGRWRGWPGQGKNSGIRSGSDGPEHAAHGRADIDQGVAGDIKLSEGANSHADHRVERRDEVK